MIRLMTGAHAALALSLAIVASAAERQRPMVVDDLFTIARIVAVAVSGDGEWIAVSATRPEPYAAWASREFYARSDIWLVNRRSGAHHNLTDGAAESSGSWLPIWSPDSRHLAFVSSKPVNGATTADDNVRLYVWDKSTGKVQCLSEAGIDLRVRIRTPGADAQAIAWIGNSRVLAAFLPAGETSQERVSFEKHGVLSGMRAWKRRLDTDEPTASILESGVSQPRPSHTISLEWVDVVEGSSFHVTDLPKWDVYSSEAVLQLDVAPDLKRASVLAVTGTVEHAKDRRLAWSAGLRTHRVGIVTFERSAPMTWIESDSWLNGVSGQLAGWREDSGAFAVLQRLQPWKFPERRAAYVISVQNGAVRRMGPSSMTLDAILWDGGGRLIAHGRQLAEDGLPSRWDWWRIDASHTPVNLTASATAVPARLCRTSMGNRFVGVAADALWSVDTRHDAVLRLTMEPLSGGDDLICAPPGLRASKLQQAMLQDKDRSIRSLVRLTFDPERAGNVRVVTVPLPSSMTTQVHADRSSEFLVFEDVAPDGTFIWVTDANGGKAIRGLAFNEHLAQIAEAQRQLISYRGTDGNPLKALVFLPPDYQPGKRYPTVVWVYATSVIRDTSTLAGGKNNSMWLNVDLLAARGYVVLHPSIPVAGFNSKSDIWIQVPKGVIAAVDKLIDAGIADPGRLGVLGHSMGGYSAYAMVTYTTRFQAAVALSGHPNLFSLYGQFLALGRYDDWAHESLLGAAMSDTGPFAMGGSPWDDLWHYLRNSPLSYLDRVETPLLIIQGEMDGVPLVQGEEAFTGLYRMGKRAKFIRYWGEGHNLSSAANIRHVWAQIFDWMDTRLKAPLSNEAP